MGATNIPWEIDTAVLRRFEKKIYIGLPDAKSREQIFILSTKGVDRDETVDFKELANISDGYTGSDIASVCREVVMLPIRELDVAGDLGNPSKSFSVRKITMDDFVKSLKKVKPVVSKADIQKFLDWQNEFGG